MLREKARVLKKMFFAAKYAKYERVSKRLYISSLCFSYKTGIVVLYKLTSSF